MNTMHDNPMLISFYGDDFTGSTDVMESLALNGIPTALFLAPPTASALKDFQLKQKVGGDTLRAFGVAGIARSLAPQEMERELESVFEQISRIPTRFFHYKVCSTLDSSPEVGNIGRALEVAMRHFPSLHIPFVLGAPFLNRFVIFGNLFARIGDATFRLDRHPVMAHHPVTPMGESDIGRHLSLQSDRPYRNFDLHRMDLPAAERAQAYREIAGSEGELIIFDTLYDTQLPIVGGLIWENAGEQSQLLAGSSGVSFALARYLQQSGQVPSDIPVAYAAPADRLLAVAGSCSPVTDAQIGYALRRGFADIPLDVRQLADTRSHAAEVERVLTLALDAIAQDRHPMIYSARGPEDPSITAIQALGDAATTGPLIGQALGQITREVLERSGIRRAIIAGGDTSGYVARALEIYALETVCPIAPGAPLCLAHSKLPAFDGLEISLKGGQCGKENYIEAILNGRP